eukprot:SAG31_NODE_1577_length_7836_cov_3.212744_2_plen_81_part_00
MQPQDMTMAELKAYNGTGPESAPILVAISGRIFNVWRSRWRYIEGGEYAQVRKGTVHLKLTMCYDFADDIAKSLYVFGCP